MILANSSVPKIQGSRHMCILRLLYSLHSTKGTLCILDACKERGGGGGVCGTDIYYTK